MKRRKFITLFGSAVVVPPRSGLAQRVGKKRIGGLLFGTPDTDPNLSAFRRGLREFGYVEGQNIVIEYRFAEGKSERLRDLAAELASIKPDLIFALGGDVAPLVRAATSTIPIVMVVSVDPVQAGLVASLARPGGNITGVTFVSSDLAAKRLQLLREMAPNIKGIVVIWNPDHIDPEYRETQAAAKTLGIQVQSLEVRTTDDFRTAFQTIDARSEALIPVSSRLMLANRALIMQFASQRRLLVASSWALWAREGALFSYGPDLDAITMAGSQVCRQDHSRCKTGRTSRRGADYISVGH